MKTSILKKRLKLKEILENTYDFKYINLSRNLNYYTDNEIDKMYLILGLKLKERKELKKILKEFDSCV